MNMKAYHYSKCSTCRSALKWLDAKGLQPEKIDLVQQPPSKEELRELLKNSGLDIRKFLNTSGELYKSMGMKDKLPTLTEDEILELLSANGKLIKRPIVTDGQRVTVGFKEDVFEQVWS